MSIKDRLKSFAKNYDPISTLEKNLKRMYVTFAAVAVLAGGGLGYLQYEDGKAREELKRLYLIKDNHEEKYKRMTELEKEISTFNKLRSPILIQTAGLSGLALILWQVSRKKPKKDDKESES